MSLGASNFGQIARDPIPVANGRHRSIVMGMAPKKQAGNTGMTRTDIEATIKGELGAAGSPESRRFVHYVEGAISALTGVLEASDGAALERGN